MRWFWVVLGVLLALAAGFIVLPNFIKVKYGPTALNNAVRSYNVLPAGPVHSGIPITFNVFIASIPAPQLVEVRVGQELHPFQLANDGQPPDADPQDNVWSGVGQLTCHTGTYSVCVVLHRGKDELIWLAPPLEVLP